MMVSPEIFHSGSKWTLSNFSPNIPEKPTRPSEMKVIRKEFPRVRETKKSGSKYYEVDWFLDVFSGLTFRIGCL